MIVLVPVSIYEDLLPMAQALVPQARLLPYQGDGSVAAGIEDAEVVLRWVAGHGYDTVVKNAPRVRWLHTASAGIDHILETGVQDKPGLIITDSGPAFEITIPEFVLAWMLLVARRLPDLIAQQKEHKWKALVQQELYGKTVGIIGLGPIGRGVAARTKPFGMRTLGFRRRAEAVPNIDEVLTGPDGLQKLLTESDYVILAAALTKESRALIGADQLAQMKSTSWLINIARGAMIDQDALVSALTSGQIAGACLDVFTEEPLPKDNPLWDLPNVYVAPHNSQGLTEALRERQKALFLENLRRFVANEPLENVVDAARGY